MPLATQRRPISKGLWAGSIVSALVALMLLADSVSKMMKAAPVLKAQAELGFPDSLTVGIGVVLFTCIRSRERGYRFSTQRSSNSILRRGAASTERRSRPP